MNQNIFDVFATCLEEIKRGATVEECLRKYPDIAEELRPSLEAAVAAKSLVITNVPHEVSNRSRTRMLGYAEKLRTVNPRRTPFYRFPLIVFSALLLALVLILGSRELVVVSAESLPGDSLYPIKRAVQDIRVRLAPNREAKHEIEALYRVQRIEEVQILLAAGRIELVSFDGVVNQMNPNKWNVGGIPVILTENSVIIGDISVGSFIEVEGFTNTAGWIEAHELHLREFEFVGQVESMELERWVISNLEFEIIPSTQLYSGAQVGDEVLVLARIRDDGTQYALAIIRLPTYIKNPEITINDPAALIAGKKAGEEIEFYGTVDIITSSYWIIDGYTVSVSLLTEVSDDIGIGDYIKVHVVVGENSTLIAREIDLGGDQVGDDPESGVGDQGSDDFDEGTDDQHDDNDQGDDSSQQEDDESGNDDSNNDDSDVGDEVGDDGDDDSDDDGGDSDDGSDDESDSGSDDESDSGSDDEPEEPEEPEEPDDPED